MQYEYNGNANLYLIRVERTYVSEVGGTWNAGWYVGGHVRGRGGVNALLTPPTLQTASDSYEERALT